MEEITVEALNTKDFIEQKVDEISRTVGDGLAINALSGGVDSSAVTMLGHRALGDVGAVPMINRDIRALDLSAEFG